MTDASVEALCAALAESPLAYGPAFATHVSRALAPALAHDRLFFVAVEPGASELHLLAADSPLLERIAGQSVPPPPAEALLPLPTLANLEALFEVESFVSRDTSVDDPPLPFKRTLARAGFRRYVTVKLPTREGRARAWCAVAYREAEGEGRGASCEAALTALRSMRALLAFAVGSAFELARSERLRVAQQAELERRSGALAFLRDLTETVAGELDAAQAIHRAIALLRGRPSVRGVAIARAHREGAGLTLVAARGLPPPLLMRFLALGLSLTEERVTHVPPALAQSAPGGAVPLFLPLRHADRLVGAALVLLEGALDLQERELLEAAARTVAVALHASVEYAEVARFAAERRQLLDTIPSIVFRLDPATGATEYANAAGERVLGVALELELDRPGAGLAARLYDDAQRDTWDRAVSSAAAGQPSSWEDYRFRHADGRTVVLRARMSRVEGPRSRLLVEGVAQDVTDEIEAQKRLIQADRLASLGMLAAGVAHEINNPAAFILLGIQHLNRLMSALDEAQSLATSEGAGARSETRKRIGDVLNDLSDGVQRIVQIVGELKLFARIPESAFSTPVDVNRLLESAITLAQAELRHRARVEIDLGDLPPLPGDHARLGQVFVNLLVNAAQAIQPGDEDANAVRVRTRASGGEIVVEVSDTGVGIAPEHLGRIFDPFFTTKAPGEGTGLGLAISYDLVRRAGGSISVESEQGRGTTFRVRLPVREVPPARESRPRLSAPPTGGRVLIVEDEHHLAVAIARTLAPRYRVELAPDGASAVGRIESSPEAMPFDAVLCDLRMPGMDGRALYREVCAKKPALAQRFVFLTGAGLGSEYEPFVRGVDRPVLEKPFEMAELEDVVAQTVIGL